jgi:hypothetical protein
MHKRTCLISSEGQSLQQIADKLNRQGIANAD